MIETGLQRGDTIPTAHLERCGMCGGRFCECAQVWPVPMDAEERLHRLRKMVVTAWRTGVPGFRQYYDAELLDLLGVRSFQELSDVTAAQKRIRETVLCMSR
jgi:hypothetical protein